MEMLDGVTYTRMCGQSIAASNTTLAFRWLTEAGMWRLVSARAYSALLTFVGPSRDAPGNQEPSMCFDTLRLLISLMPL